MRKWGRDALLILSLLLLALLLYFFMEGRGEGDSVRISVDGRAEYSIPLAQSGDYSINGGSNILRIEGGKARIIDADCPDKLCVKSGEVSKTGESIICLPNRVMISIESEMEGEVDFIL